MVYIIVLNFNNPNVTLECLESLKCLSFNDYHIILVDNASTDNSTDIFYDYLQANQNIIFLRAKENRGYAAGNNIALQYALKQQDMEYCWILNNDTVVTKDSLSKLYEYMEIEDKINFLFFGRIEEYKGIDVLLDAYQKLENYYPQKTSLTIAGRGDIAKYQNKINKFESVYVLNRMILDSEISSLYAGNNIVTVLPYKDATQSGVIPTAQIFNSLIIASDVGAIREQLDDGKLGILIKPNDVEALYLAMKMVVSNIYDSEYKDMKDKGYVFVKKLKWNLLGKKLLECISFFSYKEV